jgi:hypothetical protein
VSRAGAPAAEFDARILPSLEAIPFFRAPTDEEVKPAFAAYQARDFARLLTGWAATAQATRANLPPALSFAYDRAYLAPRLANGIAFLASVRAVLRAGERFRATLSPAVRALLEGEFPWLEQRHRHIPDGWTPPLVFPEAFRLFIDCEDLDAARVRWQLVCGLNEVQQAHYSADAARRFRLPALMRHAARERALALHYFARWAPVVDEGLFRQAITVLDGLNAAVFDMMCRREAARMIGRSMLGALTGRDEWDRFVAGLDDPPPLL